MCFLMSSFLTVQECLHCKDFYLDQKNCVNQPFFLCSERIFSFRSPSTNMYYRKLIRKLNLLGMFVEEGAVVHIVDV